MGGLESDTIGGFNSFVENQSQMDGMTTLTTVLFDDKYEILWDGVDSKKVKLTGKDYYVRGSTALLDAIGKTILDVGCRLSKTTENERPGKVVFVITTDGLENSSKEFSFDKVRELIQHQQQKYNWEFIFLGANIDVTKEAGSLGICEENAYSFQASTRGVDTMYSIAREAVSNYRAGKKKNERSC